MPRTVSFTTTDGRDTCRLTTLTSTIVQVDEHTEVEGCVRVTQIFADRIVATNVLGTLEEIVTAVWGPEAMAIQ